MKDLNDKIIGSLVGGAVGDALGYPVEFIYSHDELARKYGASGITEYDRSCSWKKGQIRWDKALFSDDTQMTLYTAEGLLYAIENNQPILPTICNAYLYWFGGQTGKKIKSSYPSKLFDIEEINQNRAPGNTCMSALLSIFSGKEPSNNSKGCGGVMRIAPIALYGAAHGWPLEQTAKLAGDAAALTHHHPMSTLASSCCAAIIQQCAVAEGEITVDGFKNIVAASLECVENVYPEFSCVEEFCGIVNNALILRESPLDDWQIIEQELGGGWVGDEALAIAIFSVARHILSFEECVVCAVNHGGDSDSTGTVAGNIIGAILGRKAIPKKFTDTLQLYELIESTAKDLAHYH